VRTRYAPAVKAYRARAARAQTSLVVAIDADTEDVARRTRQLEDSLAAEELSSRSNTERIVHLIPKRNIETWILNLNGNPVDEETDFRRAPGIESQIGSAAQTSSGGPGLTVYLLCTVLLPCTRPSTNLGASNTSSSQVPALTSAHSANSAPPSPGLRSPPQAPC
jgi:hypothetical protein